MCGCLSPSPSPCGWQPGCVLAVAVPGITAITAGNAHAVSPPGTPKQPCIAARASPPAAPAAARPEGSRAAGAVGTAALPSLPGPAPPARSSSRSRAAALSCPLLISPCFKGVFETGTRDSLASPVPSLCSIPDPGRGAQPARPGCLGSGSAAQGWALEKRLLPVPAEPAELGRGHCGSRARRGQPSPLPASIRQPVTLSNRSVSRTGTKYSLTI